MFGVCLSPDLYLIDPAFMCLKQRPARHCVKNEQIRVENIDRNLTTITIRGMHEVLLRINKPIERGSGLSVKLSSTLMKTNSKGTTRSTACLRFTKKRGVF